MSNVDEPLDTHSAAEMIAKRLEESAADQPEAESVEEVSDEVEEVEAEADIEEAEEAEADDEGEGSEEASIATLAELAEAMGVDISALTGIRHTFRANGEDIEASLEELVSGYQKDADYTRKTQELAERRKQSEQEIASHRQMYETAAQQMADYLNQVETVLVGTLDSAEMEALRASNPQEWMVRRTDFQDRLQAVQNFRQQSAQTWERQRHMLEQQQVQQLQEYRARELEALRSAIPEWSDELGGALRDFAGKQYGFTPDEVNAVMDHRYFRLAVDAQKYHELKAKTDAAVKKVQKAPQMQKPSKTAKPMSVSTRKMLDARKKLKASGSLDDAAEALAAQLQR